MGPDYVLEEDFGRTQEAIVGGFNVKFIAKGSY